MEIKEFIASLFPFKGLSSDQLDGILENMIPEIREFKKHDEIYTPHRYEKKIGFIMEGECEVLRLGKNGVLPLNDLKISDSFGILALFSDKDDYPTEIRAKKSSKVVFFAKEQIKLLLENYPVIALNMISFLSNRVEFLNDKIATLSAPSVEDKLLNFLHSEAERLSTSTIPFNCKKTAEVISCGRASLYRALNSLADEGVITQLDKKIIINFPKGHERKNT